MSRLTLLPTLLLASAFALEATDRPLIPDLEPITADNLEAHIKFLAADELEGRETADRGSEVAALYIASQFRAMGLRAPGSSAAADLASHYQRFDLDASLLENLNLAIAGKEFKVGEDYLVFPFTGGGQLEGEIVFCGYGITAPEFDYDDYAGIDVKGKIALVMRHEPHETAKDLGAWFDGESHSRHALFVTKYKNAVAHGAGAMLLVNDPLHCSEQRHFGTASGRAIRGLRSDRKKDAESDRHTQPTIPAVFAGKAVLDLLSEKLDLAKLQQTIDQTRQGKAVATGLRARLSIDRLDTVARTWNVAAVLEGSDPELKKEWVIVGAHFDHEGVQNGEVMNGANDNASGTSALLLIAEALAAQATPPRRSILFIAFNAEEKGLLGSKHYVENPLVPLEDTVAMINMDMIGRSTKNTVDVAGGIWCSVLDTISREALDAAGIDSPTFGDFRISSRSDHYPFYARGIPILVYHSDDMRDYHKPTDDIEKITVDMLERIAKSIAMTVWGTANSEERPRLKKLGQF